MSWLLVDIVMGVDHTHPPPQFHIPQLSPGCITSIQSSHPQPGPVLGHTGGDQAGAMTIVTKRMNSSQPSYHLEVPICRFNFLFILLESYPHLFKQCETIHKQCIKSEQRRRDELRDSYACLNNTLPASNQKSSKVFLLN